MLDRRMLGNIDWTLCGLVLMISGIGLIALSSATVGSPGQENYLMYQIYRIFAGIGVIILTQLIHYRNWARLGFIMHLVVIGLLVLVLFYGTGGPGAPVQRWLKLGPFFFQPSEFSKFTLVLALSHHFREFQRPKGNWLWMIWPLILMAVPVVLIIKQPDLGTAMLLLIVFIPIIFMMGIRFKTIVILGVMTLASLPVLWIYVLKPYQKGRILTFLNPERDPLGAGYHIIQSKIAIGSGRVLGKGFGEGTQGQLNFLPAHHTDFIFNTCTLVSCRGFEVKKSCKCNSNYWNCCNHNFSCFNQYRHDNRFNAGSWSSSTFFQLWWFLNAVNDVRNRTFA